MAPADENECRMMLSTGFQHHGPAAIRYPRGTGPGVAIHHDLDTLPIGTADLRRRGHGLALLSFGATLPAAPTLPPQLRPTLATLPFATPLDAPTTSAYSHPHTTSAPP